MKKGYSFPVRFNVFDQAGMLVHRAGRCEYSAVEAEQVAAESGGDVAPASGAAAEVDAAIRLAEQRKGRAA